jgi:hypothetical protein
VDLVYEEGAKFATLPLVTKCSLVPIKCGFDPEKADRSVLHFTAGFYNKILFPRYKNVIQQLSDVQHGDDEALWLTPAILKSLFDPVLDDLLREVDKVLHASQRQTGGNIDYLFLVGGFSQSKYLRQRIAERFKTAVKKIVTPTRPGLAVLKGAVAYGLDASIIRARRSRLTYGCGMRASFVEGVDPESKKEWDEERHSWKCNGRFMTFVTIGELVPVDKTVTHSFLPRESKDQSAYFGLYVTTRQKVRYTDEPGVQRIGSIKVETPGEGLDRECTLTMHFGETEIRVSLHDLTSGNRKEATVEFQSVHFPELLGE